MDGSVADVEQRFLASEFLSLGGVLDRDDLGPYLPGQGIVQSFVHGPQASGSVEIVFPLRHVTLACWHDTLCRREAIMYLTQHESGSNQNGL